MKYFPLFLKMAGRRVVIAGGGEQAAQKARLLGRTEARLEFLAPELTSELAELVAEGRADHAAGAVTPESFRGAALAVICTGSPVADALLAEMARAAGAVVNVVDRPALCDAITPAIVDRDPVVVAIGTEGTAPVLARQIKTALESMLEPGLGRLAARAAEMRDEAAARLEPRNRRDFWAWVFGGEPRARHAAGDEAGAAALMAAALERGEVPAVAPSVSFVQVPAAGADLLPLRAVRRLQEADLVLHDPDTPSAALELARRDADRAEAGPDAAAQVMAEAAAGRRVVRLVAGDASAEVAALATAGLVPEVLV